MHISQQFVTCAGALLLSLSALAQTPPAAAPAGATGLCKDGSYSTSPSKRGACHGHHGVQDWYAANGSAPAQSAGPAAAAAATPVPTKSVPSVAQAPGAAPGMVWVNTNSNVYHCPADRWYGKTKQGAYMTEVDAVAKGNRPDHGKACR